MRKLILISLALVLFGGCVTTSIESDGGFTSFGIDFRSYTNEDFLITTEQPNGDYKTIGLIEVYQTPEIKESTEAEYDKESDKGYRGVKITRNAVIEYYLVEIIETQKSIDELYKISKEWGANGLFNLKISRDTHPHIPSVDIITVSGLAVLIE